MIRKKGQNMNLGRLLKQAQELGCEVRMEKLEAGGIRCSDGICLIKGKRHIFLDKRRPPKELVLQLMEYLEKVSDEPS